MIACEKVVCGQAVCDVSEGEGGRRRRRRTGVTSKKQEPHTKMWETSGRLFQSHWALARTRSAALDCEILLHGTMSEAESLHNLKKGNPISTARAIPISLTTFQETSQWTQFTSIHMNNSLRKLRGKCYPR